MSTHADTLLLIAFGLACYTLGASVIEGQVNYRTWHLIGNERFRSYHRAMGPRIVAYLVVPYGASVLLTLALIFWHPEQVLLSPLIFALGLKAIAIVVTLKWQFPTQRVLDQSGWSDARVARLIRIEWFRLIPHLLNAVLFAWMLERIVVAHYQRVP
jgi:hypothetical protein